MRPTLHLLFFALLCLTSCRPGTGDAELEDMQAQINSLERSVAQEEAQLRERAAFHHEWMRSRTDSTLSSLAHVRFTADSAYRAGVLAQDTRFHDWFVLCIHQSRQMRLQVNEMRNWLGRQEQDPWSRVRSSRAFTSKLADYLRKSREYAPLADGYELFSGRYSRIGVDN